MTNLNYLAQLKIGDKEITAPQGVPTGGTGTGSLIVQGAITLFLMAGIIIALFYFIQAGIQWTTSGGDKQRIEQARMKLTYAVVGLIIMFSSFFLINLVFGFFKIDFFSIK